MDDGGTRTEIERHADAFLGAARRVGISRAKVWPPALISQWILMAALAIIMTVALVPLAGEVRWPPAKEHVLLVALVGCVLLFLGYLFIAAFGRLGRYRRFRLLKMDEGVAE
jgi:hypothetical protein